MAETVETQNPITAAPEQRSSAAPQPALKAPPQEPAPRKRGKAMLILAFVGLLLLAGGTAPLGPRLSLAESARSDPEPTYRTESPDRPLSNHP